MIPKTVVIKTNNLHNFFFLKMPVHIILKQSAIKMMIVLYFAKLEQNVASCNIILLYNLPCSYFRQLAAPAQGSAFLYSFQSSLWIHGSHEEMQGLHHNPLWFPECTEFMQIQYHKLPYHMTRTALRALPLQNY